MLINMKITQQSHEQTTHFSYLLVKLFYTCNPLHKSHQVRYTQLQNSFFKSKITMDFNYFAKKRL